MSERKSKPPVLALFSGHTGGHLFPAFAFAETFHARHPESLIYLVTSPKARPLVGATSPGVFASIEYLNEFPFPSGISLRTLLFLLEFARAFFLTLVILLKNKPDLCIGFGSYVSFPGIFLGKFLRIPTLIHEQNQVPGKATLSLLPYADCVASSFENSFQGRPVRRLEITGLPLRRKLFDACRLAGSYGRRKRDTSAIRILVTGGSQGAKKLNDIIFETFLLLSSEERNKFAVIHLTGHADYLRVTENYKKMKINFETYPFYENMQELLSRTDLALTRAGANTLFELALFGIPAVVVPYPYAGGHQEDNARYFAERQAILIKKEEELSPEWLAGTLRTFLADESFRLGLSERISGISTGDAAEKLAGLAQDLLKEASHARH